MCHTCQATDHQMDHGNANHGLARLGQILIILGQAAVPAQPREGALNNPPFREEQEAFGALGPPDNLQADVPPGPQGPDPGDEIPAIGLIRPDQPQAGEQVPHPSQEMHGPLAILQAGGGDGHRQQEA